MILAVILVGGEATTADGGVPHDVVVVGDGVAGLTAALFAARLGLRTLVLGSGGLGGALMNTERVEDFPGFDEGISGFELGPRLQDQATNAGAELQVGEATGLRESDGGWSVATHEGELAGRAVIVATGTRPRRLGVPGEDELEGKGISHCANCDGPLFRGRTVGVVGGGDSALLEALELTAHEVRVVVLDREPAFRAQEAYRRRVASSDAIAERHGVAVEAIVGDGTVAAARVRDLATDRVEDIEVAALFVHAGRERNTAWVAGALALDEGGGIRTDAWMHTEAPGVLAAGDVRSDSAGQAITAAGDGATAAIAAHRLLAEERDPP